MINDINLNKITSTNTTPQQKPSSSTDKTNSFSTLLSELNSSKEKSVELNSTNETSSAYQELPVSVTAQFYKIFGDTTQTSLQDF